MELRGAVEQQRSKFEPDSLMALDLSETEIINHICEFVAGLEGTNVKVAAYCWYSFWTLVVMNDNILNT